MDLDQAAKEKAPVRTTPQVSAPIVTGAGPEGLGTVALVAQEGAMLTVKVKVKRPDPAQPDVEFDFDGSIHRFARTCQSHGLKPSESNDVALAMGSLWAGIGG